MKKKKEKKIDCQEISRHIAYATTFVLFHSILPTNISERDCSSLN